VRRRSKNKLRGSSGAFFSIGLVSGGSRERAWPSFFRGGFVSSRLRGMFRFLARSALVACGVVGRFIAFLKEKGLYDVPLLVKAPRRQRLSIVR
jgi:hypothetical protein